MVLVIDDSEAVNVRRRRRRHRHGGGWWVMLSPGVRVGIWREEPSASPPAAFGDIWGDSTVVVIAVFHCSCTYLLVFCIFLPSALFSTQHRTMDHDHEPLMTYCRLPPERGTIGSYDKWQQHQIHPIAVGIDFCALPDTRLQGAVIVSYHSICSYSYAAMPSILYVSVSIDSAYTVQSAFVSQSSLRDYQHNAHSKNHLRLSLAHSAVLLHIRGNIPPTPTTCRCRRIRHSHHWWN